MFGVYSQQKVNILPPSSKGYIVLKIDGALKKTYDMVNFTTLVNTSDNFNRAKYNPNNNCIYYSDGLGSIKKLDLNTNTILLVNSTPSSNPTFQLNITNNSLIYSVSASQIRRVNLVNNAATTVNITHNSVQDATVLSHYILSSSTTNSQLSYTSTNGTSWTTTMTASGTGVSATVIPGVYDLSYYHYYTGSGNRQRGISFDGAISRYNIYNDTTTYSLAAPIYFGNDEYTIQRSGSRVIHVTTDKLTWSSYTLPGNANYTIRNGVVSPNGTYILTTNNNSNQIVRKTNVLTSSSWTVLNPFSNATNEIYYTNRFIVMQNNFKASYSTDEGLTWTESNIDITSSTGRCFVPE